MSKRDAVFGKGVSDQELQDQYGVNDSGSEYVVDGGRADRALRRQAAEGQH